MNLAAPISASQTVAARQRERDIIAAVRGIFAEKGFDGASMQDLARAAGMSAGNFYRYFPSKAALIAAMIRSHLAEVEAEFAAIVAAPHPLEALRRSLHNRIQSEGQCCDDAAIWAEITAVALRKADIAQVVHGVEDEIAQYLTQAMALSLGLPPADGRTRFAAQARLLVLLVKGHAMQQRVRGQVMPDLTARVIRMVDDILDDIETTARATAADAGETSRGL